MIDLFCSSNFVQSPATEFNHDGKTYRKRRRDDLIAIFDVIHPIAGHIGYELVRIHIQPAGEMFGKHYQEREAYPPSSSWGSDGWSYLKSELAKAEKKFRNLIWCVGHGWLHCGVKAHPTGPGFHARPGSKYKFDLGEMRSVYEREFRHFRR
jgi:hypothetical protein